MANEPKFSNENHIPASMGFFGVFEATLEHLLFFHGASLESFRADMEFLWVPLELDLGASGPVHFHFSVCGLLCVECLWVPVFLG